MNPIPLETIIVDLRCLWDGIVAEHGAESVRLTTWSECLINNDNWKTFTLRKHVHTSVDMALNTEVRN